jgi:uncharacterized SAM-binding protein YcdF (DUF218 family)
MSTLAEAPASRQPGRCVRVVRWLALLAAGVLVLLVLTPGVWLPAIGQWLVVSRSPQPADAIIVLGGGNGERTRTGVRLYDAKLAPFLVTTGDVGDLHEIVEQTQAELDAMLAERLGVPQEAITTLERSSSTREDALFSLELARARGWRRLIVVTSPYHTRRSGLVFRNVFAGTGITPTITLANPSRNQPAQWWTRERDLLDVSGEYLKLVYYALQGWL